MLSQSFVMRLTTQQTTLLSETVRNLWNLSQIKIQHIHHDTTVPTGLFLNMHQKQHYCKLHCYKMHHTANA